MELTNKLIIRSLYETFNQKYAEKISSYVSSNYKSATGETGVDAFKKSIIALTTSFSNPHWEIVEIIAEGNKVFVKQRFTGVHTAEFQNIEPTNKPVAVDGYATYEIVKEKIIHSSVQTDRLSFMQQLGIVKTGTPASKDSPVFFIDKFFVPKTSIDEFKIQMEKNRTFIKSLVGYVGSEVYEQTDRQGNSTILTIATWETQEKLDQAKNLVQVEFKRSGFNPTDFYQRLNITMDRGLYKALAK